MRACAGERPCTKRAWHLRLRTNERGGQCDATVFGCVRNRGPAQRVVEKGAVSERVYLGNLSPHKGTIYNTVYYKTKALS